MTRTSTLGIVGAVAILSLVAISRTWSPAALDSSIVLERVPGGGIQPQAASDGEGGVHVVYYTGDASAGDLYYVHRDREGRYTRPVRVNSQPRSAIAAGSVRGAQLATGRNGRFHVIWNGSPSAQPGMPGGMPLFYTRWTGAGFEPQRNLLTSNAVDGGGAVVADGAGHVLVAWHAVPAGATDAEGAVFIRRSDDDGGSYEPERRVGDASFGACACCSMRGLIDRSDTLWLLYRAAGRGVDRDSMLLLSRDLGETFATTLVQPWRIDACPLSSYALAEAGETVVAAWETAGSIFVRRGGGPAQSVPGASTSRKHPVLASNARGDTLAAWLEDTAWARGGSVAWQRYDATGAAIGALGSADGVPAWGLAAAAPLADGRFLILY